MNAVIAEAFAPDTFEAAAGTHHRPLPVDALRHVKVAYTLRRLREADARSLLVAAVKPRAGDIVLARVERLGQHNGLQLRSGRRATLFEGDEVLVAYGDRYAPDQYEGVVPEDLAACDLIAAGGIAGRLLCAHKRMRIPTRLRPLGLLADAQGERLNLRRYALPSIEGLARRPPVLVVVGTAMNAGKTTAASHLIRGLTSAGLRVGAAKLTGTGSCGDTALMSDAGAQLALDFTDAGLATTYRADLAELGRAAESLLDHLARHDVEVIVVEIADGLLQRETAGLLNSARFARRISGVLFASGDALGAVGGVDWLEHRALPVIAVTGALTASPLAIREAAGATRLPVLGLDALSNANAARDLLQAAVARQRSEIVEAGA